MAETKKRKKPEPVLEDMDLDIRPENPPSRMRMSKYDALVDRIVEIEDDGWYRLGGDFDSIGTASKVRTALLNRLKQRGYGGVFRLKSQATEGGAGVWVALTPEKPEEEPEESEAEELT